MLHVRDHQCLTIATRHYPHHGMRVDAMHELAGLTPTRFWARINRLLADPDAERERPTEIRRLRRILERRAAARTA